MTREEFIGGCVDRGWQWVEDDGAVYIKLKNGRVVETRDKFSLALLNHIGSYDVIHMTRIVGYYSRISNWNDSKLGELADRHKGIYDV